MAVRTPPKGAIDSDAPTPALRWPCAWQPLRRSGDLETIQVHHLVPSCYKVPHEHVPGIIGRVGTILGQNDINISFMHVGRRGPRTESIMALGIDEVAPEPLRQQISSWEDINWLRSITL